MICPQRVIAGGKEPAEPHLELGAQSHELVGAYGALINRDPSSHAAKLCKELEGAFAANDDRRALAVADRHGIYLEFIGPQNGDLTTGSLEDVRRGVRLLNVRQVGDVTRATVFIPSGKERFFLDRVEAYGDPHQVTKKGKPRHEKLVSSIEDIRLAIVDSLWTGSDDKRPADLKQWIEVWLRTGKDEDGSLFEAYSALLDKLHIEHKSAFILFPERMVTLAYANRPTSCARTTRRRRLFL